MSGFLKAASVKHNLKEGEDSTSYFCSLLQRIVGERVFLWLHAFVLTVTATKHAPVLTRRTVGCDACLPLDFGGEHLSRPLGLVWSRHSTHLESNLPHKPYDCIQHQQCITSCVRPIKWIQGASIPRFCVTSQTSPLAINLTPLPVESRDSHVTPL